MGWNWAAIEALAAIAGVVGLIVSVIFLIYEIRHNARAIEAATVQELMTFEREVFAMMIQHADLFRRGCEDLYALADGERFQFDRLLGAHFSLLYSAFIQYERGIMGQDVWEAYLNALARYAAFPSYAVIWENIRAGYPENMQQAIEATITQERKRSGKVAWELEAPGG